MSLELTLAEQGLEELCAQLPVSQNIETVKKYVDGVMVKGIAYLNTVLDMKPKIITIPKKNGQEVTYTHEYINEKLKAINTLVNISRHVVVRYSKEKEEREKEEIFKNTPDNLKWKKNIAVVE